LIRKVRSALICASVESTTDGVNYLDVVGDEILVESQPGFAEAWISLHLELDDKPTKWRVELKADHFEQTIRGAQDPGLGVVAIAFPFLLPVLRIDVLTAAIFNDGRPEPVGTCGWRTGFEAGAKSLPAAAGREFVREAKRHAEEIREALTHRKEAPPQTSKLD